MYNFEWDRKKNTINYQKHQVYFDEAKKAFFDNNRIILDDNDHSDLEKRFFCIGVVESKVLTVRFTMRDNTIRIIGAGYWRKGKKIYEQR